MDRRWTRKTACTAVRYSVVCSSQEIDEKERKVQHRRIIKRGPVILAANEDGSISPSTTSSQGLFLADTRYLSRFQIYINGECPILLGSSEEDLFQSSFTQTCSQLGDIPERGIGLLQRNRIDESAVRIEIDIINWSLKPASVEISIELDSDFFDSFEARGVRRGKRGQLLPPKITPNGIELGYVGLDSITRSTSIEAQPATERFENSRLYFPMALDVGQRESIVLEIRMVEHAPEGVSLQPSPSRTGSGKPSWFDAHSKVRTSNATINAILQRSQDDLESLMLEFEGVWVPAAGLPRFGVPFGRDSLITALQTLVWNHHVARDVLCFLAARQGKEENPWNYEQPGKIMHEMHTGELARLREVPFGLFYGSVDSTPLFLVLGAEYMRWTNDMALYRELEPAFDAAWEWIDRYGDIDGSGYIQYQAHTPPKVSSAALTVGLFNQGWKDSATAVTYADGTMCTDHPVSLAEVQGDLYRALTVWSAVFAAMAPAERKAERATQLATRAARLKEQFNRDFWMPHRNYFAMALDGHHRQVDSITSNPAECLWARLIDDDKAEALVRTIMDEPMFATWGIRTMSRTEKAYNPLSYHDGSVWPFENGIIAQGLKKYGYVRETQDVLDALLDASLYFEYRRWPEVYTGVSKRTGGILARQPDACRPQAWSAGLMFMFVQNILGISANPFSTRIDLTPALPSCLDEIVLENCSIADASLSLRLVRQDTHVLLDIMDNPAGLDIVVHPATSRREAAQEHGTAVSG
jgi:glycogen debranching enzyme